MSCEVPKNTKQKGTLTWWQLSLSGVGCTIGTGYFLGSAIGIELTGPSIVLSFLLAAIGTYMVFHLLAKLTSNDPQEGSFCYYAQKAFGRWAGFSCGWNYWCSNVLIMGSQLIALSILSQFWFPHFPLWAFAAIYAVLSVVVVLLGTDSFEKVEDILAIIKTAAIIMFITIGVLALTGLINGGSDERPGIPQSFEAMFSGGLGGFWASLIYAFYAFGGIEVIGLMALRLKNSEDAPKSGRMMLFLLTIIYVTSLILAVVMVPVSAFNPEESPFVTALADYPLAFFPHVFNAAIIVAGFSAMTAALYGVTTLLVTLAKDEDAPAIFKKKLKFKDLPLPSLCLGAAGLLLSVITALLLPNKIYEYITTAAGILLLYNWVFIVLSFLKITDKISGLIKTAAWGTILLLLLAVTGTVMDPAIRYGLFISVAIAGIIGFVTLVMVRRWNSRSNL